MPVDRDALKRIVENPIESLNVEIKRWLDPDSPAGKAKILRAALALRNRNGGYLLFGFDNTTRQPDPNVPSDTNAAFHPDKIQGLISRHSSKAFEIHVELVERNGILYPVIVVPPGVVTPVAVRQPINDGVTPIVKVGEVPFRTLMANGTVSTAAARPEDWDSIIDICLENREADIGRFIRRHLASVDLGALGSIVGLATPNAPTPTLSQLATELLERGDERFHARLAERSLDTREANLLNLGAWSVAAVTNPARNSNVADEAFYGTLASSHPQLAWQVWADNRWFEDPDAKPQNRQGGWESLFVNRGFTDHFDFSRYEPSAAFFHYRLHHDDAVGSARQIPPGTVLDPGLVVQEVAEAIAVASRFAKSLGLSPDSTKIGFLFRWTGLSGRVLSPWASQLRIIPGAYVARDSEVKDFIEVPLDTPDSAIAPFAQAATRKIFSVFGGYAMSDQIADERVRKLFQRRSE